MKLSKIPTILGIIVLVIGVAVGVYFVQNQSNFKLSASPEAAPQDVRVSNIGDASFTISWITDKEVVGFVKWGNDASSLSNTEVDGTNNLDFTHTITLTSLTPGTTYYYKINSGDKEFDNNGIPWQTKTAPILPGIMKNNYISGVVMTATGAPAKKSLVYVTVGGGSLLSTTTSDSGNWIVAISQARTQDLSSFITIDDKTTLIEIGVNAGPQGVSSAQIYPIAASPVPPLTLGQVHDFKSLSSSENSEVPKAEIDLPSGSSDSSGFKVNLTKSPAPTTKTVTINSIKDSEVVNTTKPEFFGDAPPGSSMTITVESENPIKEEVKIPATGSWKWSPPSNLPEGPHKITLTWKDASGIVRSLTRSFIVQAAQGGPAFVSTPSATPKVTSTPKASPSSSPSSKPTIKSEPTPTISNFPTTPATTSAIPVSGSLTPTVLLFSMGFGVLAFGLFLWQKSKDSD